MKVNVKTDENYYLPLWTFDLPNLEQHVWKWHEVDVPDLIRTMDKWLLDEDFEGKHLDPPELNDGVSNGQPEPF